MSTSATQPGTTTRAGRSGKGLGIAAAALAVVIAAGFVFAVNQGNEVDESVVQSGPAQIAAERHAERVRLLEAAALAATRPDPSAEIDRLNELALKVRAESHPGFNIEKTKMDLARPGRRCQRVSRAQPREDQDGHASQRRYELLERGQPRPQAGTSPGSAANRAESAGVGQPDALTETSKPTREGPPQGGPSLCVTSNRIPNTGYRPWSRFGRPSRELHPVRVHHRVRRVILIELGSFGVVVATQIEPGAAITRETAEEEKTMTVQQTSPPWDFVCNPQDPSMCANILPGGSGEA